MVSGVADLKCTFQTEGDKMTSASESERERKERYPYVTLLIVLLTAGAVIASIVWAIMTSK